jgi:hypothetical protein
MRDRLIEFLPLVLAGVVLLGFQLSRGEIQTFQFQALPELTPTPAIEMAAQRAPQRRPSSATVSVGVCNAAQPQFSGGMAALKSALGSSMGEPVECERAVSSQGDTQQKTTTGLAYYRKQSNVVCFTTGWDHWGLVKGGLVHWSGDDVDPPGDTPSTTR